MFNSNFSSKLAYALLFGIVYVLIPWDTILPGHFPDRLNYIGIVNNIRFGETELYSIQQFNYLEGFKFLFHEPVWYETIKALSLIFDDDNLVLQLISYFSIVVYALFIFQRVNIFLGSLFLLNPLILDLVISQIRNAFALALILLACLIRRRSIAIIFQIVSMFVHSASIPIIFVFWIAKRVTVKSWNRRVMGFTAFFIGLFVAFILAVPRQYILGWADDSRAIYDAGSSSLLYMMYWILMVVYLIFTPSRSPKQMEDSEYVGISLVATAFFLSVFSVYGVRFISLSIPFLLVGISYRSYQKQLELYSTFILYQVILYLFWLKLINLSDLLVT